MISAISTPFLARPTTMSYKDKFYEQKKAARDFKKRAADTKREGKETRVHRWAVVLETIERAFVEEVETLENGWNKLRGRKDDLEEVKIAEVEVVDDEDLDDVFTK